MVEKAELPAICVPRPIVDQVLKNYDGVLKVDGEVGKKKAYDPRTYLALSESSMAERVKQAVIE